MVTTIQNKTKKIVTTFFGLFIVVSIVFVGILDLHRVDNTLTHQDKETISIILAEHNLSPPKVNSGYKAQADFIVAVQKAVLKVAPKHKPIPFGQTREPKDVYESKYGFCYDRSRLIEKILRAANFETRHIALYSVNPKKSWKPVLPK